MPEGHLAAKPLFRDPVYDGAADPTLIFDRVAKKWLMFYTNRRANVREAPGVTWVHGTHLGIAESTDLGATWKYTGVAEINYGEADYSHWAPEIIHHDGVYHMYLTVVPGTFADWNHPRAIVQLTSTDLRRWKYESTLHLKSDRVIDACVVRLPAGGWRMWYNDETDHKAIRFADSPDLYHWQDCGKCASDIPGEGPKVFRFAGAWWMVVDIWKGLAVYRSDDLLTWTLQTERLLDQPGTGADDGIAANHATVEVSGDRAFIFYFTHPGRVDRNLSPDSVESRRSSIQVAELKIQDRRLVCDRNAPVNVRLDP